MLTILILPDLSYIVNKISHNKNKSFKEHQVVKTFKILVFYWLGFESQLWW